VQSLNEWRIHMTRVEVAPGIDAWTGLLLAFCALAILAAVIAFSVSFWRAARSPKDDEANPVLGFRLPPAGTGGNSSMSGWDIAKLMALILLLVYTGLQMLITGHASGHHHGTYYSADGPPVRFAGGLLLFCVGLLVAAGVLARRNPGPPTDV